MNRPAYILGFLLGFLLGSPPAAAQSVRVGALDVRNSLGEIAAGGPSAQAAARSNLGLGSIATQAASGVAITGGTLSGVTITLGAAGGADVTAAGGTTARTLAAWLADRHNVKAFGAVGNGTTVDLPALLAAASPIYLPEGTYYTGASIYSLTGDRRYSGMGGAGRIATLEGGVEIPQAPNLSIISAPPAAPLGTGFNRAFSGDMSMVHLAFQTVVTGATTLGQPTSGWQITPGASGIYGFLSIDQSAGWSNGTDGAGHGRTGEAASFMQVQHGGNGDATAYYAAASVSGTKAGATSFLASPAAGLFGGQVTALAAGVYLQGIGDINLNDGGNDVAAIAATYNLNRTVGTGALGATWIGVRVQQETTATTKAYDAAFSASGMGAVGLDLSDLVLQNAAGTATHSAIAMTAGQRIMGNVVNTGPFPTPGTLALGTEWLSYETGSGWNLVVGGVPILQAAAGGVVVTQLRITAPGVPASASASCSTGQLSYDAGYLYVCVATNTWKRTALSSW